MKVLGEPIDRFFTGTSIRCRSNADGVVAQQVDVEKVADRRGHIVVDQLGHLMCVFLCVVEALQDQVSHKDLSMWKDGDEFFFVCVLIMESGDERKGPCGRW